MNSARPERLERSILIAPGGDPQKLAKAAAAQADAICLDCEDAVAPDRKSEARGHVIHALNTLDFGGKLRLVRINGLDTSFAYRDLVEIVEGAGDNLDLIVVPKVNGRDEVRFVDMMLTQIEAEMGFSRRIGVEAMIETAAGLVNIRDVAAASDRLEALIFGSGDYAASAGMPLETIGALDAHDALYPGHRWHHVMHAIVTAAHAFGLRAIDGPFAPFNDGEGLERMANIARVLGFDGKWCIHPSQPETVDRIFAPSETQIAYAQSVLEAYGAATREGRGAVSVNGKMVDAANLRMCEEILARARRAGLVS